MKIIIYISILLVFLPYGIYLFNHVEFNKQVFKTSYCPQPSLNEINIGSIMIDCKDFLMCDSEKLKCVPKNKNVCCLYELKDKTEKFSPLGKTGYNPKNSEEKNENSNSTPGMHVYSYIENSKVKYSGIRDIKPV